LSLIWTRAFVLLGATLTGALVAGAIGGRVAALAFVTVVALAWGVVQFRHLVRLVAWADGPIDAPLPEAGGTWGLVFDRLQRRARTRVQQQRGLTAALERFRTAAEALPDGMVILDRHDCIVWANPRAQRHFGIHPAKDLGKPLANLVRQPEFVHYLGRGVYNEPVLFLSAREHDTMLSVQIVPYESDQKLLMSRDVTRLEEAARIRRDFIANVSHELKTPLTVLAGFVETAQSLPLERDQLLRYLQLMQEQTQSMQRLVEDLLTLSALESDVNRLREERVDVIGQIERAVRDAERLSAGEHRIRTDVRTDAQLLGSSDEIGSVVFNLTSNAVRYTPAGGTITIGWRIEAGAPVLSVADTGIGIAAEHIPRMTERFYRVDRGRSRASGGTGLGLAIVKHVLLRHGAQLEIESEPGSGSVFRARFPAARLLAAEAVDYQ
jgi:two-component system phosphate regulon sensor histidine kinase PhoR